MGWAHLTIILFNLTQYFFLCVVLSHHLAYESEDIVQLKASWNMETLNCVNYPTVFMFAYV